MSALQTEAPSMGSPTISSYRGVTASRQQQFASPSPRHSNPPWLSALSSPSPKFTAAFRPGSPSRLDISSSQPSVQPRTRPPTDRTRTQSAIFPSASDNLMSNGTRQSLSTTIGSRPQRQAQGRPVSLNAALPLAMEPSRMSKRPREEQTPSQIPQIVVQTTEQGHHQKMSRTVPQRAESPERPHQQLPPKQVPQRVGTPKRPQQLPPTQNPQRSQHHPPSEQTAQKAQPVKQTPKSQNRQQIVQTQALSSQQNLSGQTTQRPRNSEPVQHQQPPRHVVQKDKNQDRSPSETHQQHVPRENPQRAIQTPEHLPVANDREQLQQLQTTVMELERAFRTPEPAQYRQSPTYMTPKDKAQDPSAPEPNHHHVPKQTTQREAQAPEQPPVMSDHEQLQQLQITVMQLERAFHNFVNASSPNHSHKGSFDSAISNQSSLSRPSSVISPISPKSPDMKDTSLHNPAKTYTSSPLGRPATTSNDSTNNSRTNSITCDSPTAEMSPKQLEEKVKGSRLRKVLSAGSMELLGGPSETADGGHVVESTRQGAAHEARDEDRPQTHSISGHGIYGRKIFSKSVDHLAAASSTETPASASSMLRKVGKGMKRKSRTLSELFRPKSAVATGPPNTTFEAESPLTNEPLKSTVVTGFPNNTAFEAESPLTKEPLKSPVPETTPSLTWSMDMAKPNFSREDLYEALDTPELGTPDSPSFNMYRNYAPVQTQDTGAIQRPGMAPRSILKKQSQSSAYPVEFSTTPTQLFPEITSSPPLTVPNTPQTEIQDDRWVNPFETTDLETLMDALSNVYDYDEPADSVQEVDKYQPPFAPRPISYYL